MQYNYKFGTFRQFSAKNGKSNAKKICSVRNIFAIALTLTVNIQHVSAKDFVDFDLASLDDGSDVLVSGGIPAEIPDSVNGFPSQPIAPVATAAPLGKVMTERPNQILSKAKNGQPLIFTIRAKDAYQKLGYGPSGHSSGENQVIEVVVQPEQYVPVQKEARRVINSIHALSAIDAIATINCLNANKCRELNPLMGRNPSALRVLATKAVGMAFIEYQFRKGLEKNPWSTRKVAYIGLVLQGLITGFTLRTAF